MVSKRQVARGLVEVQVEAQAREASLQDDWRFGPVVMAVVPDPDARGDMGAWHRPRQCQPPLFRKRPAIVPKVLKRTVVHVPEAQVPADVR